MSRIGKQPVVVPAGVTITVSAENVLTVKGPKGQLTQNIDRDITIEVKEGEVVFTRPTDQIRHRAMHGLYRSLVNNMVKGVTEGYKKELSLGYSHNIIIEIPSELKVSTTTEKGQNPKVFLEGIDKQLIGQVAAKLRSLRKPEPYKGKGIKYSDETIKRKAGKAAKAAGAK